jgi:hypothetical protein
MYRVEHLFICKFYDYNTCRPTIGICDKNTSLWHTGMSIIVILAFELLFYAVHFNIVKMDQHSFLHTWKLFCYNHCVSLETITK